MYTVCIVEMLKLQVGGEKEEKNKENGEKIEKYRQRGQKSTMVHQLLHL